MLSNNYPDPVDEIKNREGGTKAAYRGKSRFHLATRRVKNLKRYLNDLVN